MELNNKSVLVMSSVFAYIIITSMINQPLIPNSSLNFMMNQDDCRIFLWNCRGVASPDFFRFCKKYMDGSHPYICVVMELRVDALRLKRTFRLLGFDEFHFSNVRGFSEGIVVAWLVLNIHFQFIHLQITNLNGVKWFFSVVYSNPNENQKQILWDELYHIATSVQGGWLVAGDLSQ